jgi:Methylase involved in ubiquinone/menaquinone biosynthesis
MVGHRNLKSNIGSTFLNKWNIPFGSKILEIGCGQGDFTLVAAYMVGDQGHVTGIDPAPLDYGLFI